MARLVEIAREIDDSEGLPIAKPRSKKKISFPSRASSCQAETFKRVSSSASIHGPLDMNEKETPFGKLSKTSCSDDYQLIRGLSGRNVVF